MGPKGQVCRPNHSSNTDLNDIRLSYVPLFCKNCPPENGWVGVLVAAADTKNAQYLNQVWLSLEAVCTGEELALMAPNLMTLA